MTSTPSTPDRGADTVLATVDGPVGCLTLNRPRALNALSLPMIRALTTTLLAWRDDARVQVIALRGMGREGSFGAFCAGGDIRFFHAAATSGDPALEDFFTEEYQLNHLLHHYPKPVIAFMDGIIMGGGMGLAQGATLRIATERTKMAMPETLIGLFPDVGGGYFMSRCPGALGEYLALTGQTISGAEAVHATLADVLIDAAALPDWWARLPQLDWSAPNTALASLRAAAPATAQARLKRPAWWTPALDGIFAARDVATMLHALSVSPDPRAAEVATTLRQRSPLLLHVTLELLRRGRTMALADELRLERDLVRHCFHPHHLGGGPLGARSETVEGIRALAVDKDQQPRWLHASIEAVTPGEVAPFFVSPWPAHAHPLRDLQDAPHVAAQD